MRMKTSALIASVVLSTQLVGCSQEAKREQTQPSTPQAEQKKAQADRGQEAIYEAPSSGIVGVENASMRPSSNATAYITYEKDDGTVDFVLRVEDANWTETWGKHGTPVVVTNVVGKAGVGANRDDARASLSPLQTKKDHNGAGIIYFDQASPFRGVKRFYLRNRSGYELYPVSLKAVGSQATKIVTKSD